jgi:ComF family protein
MNSWIESALCLLFPSVCEICEEPRNAASPGPCAACRSKITPVADLPAVPEEFHYDSLWACGAYQGAMKELLHRYKFNGRKGLKEFFGSLLYEAVQEKLAGAGIDAIAAVPAEPGRLAERGFDPAELSADILARKWGRPHLPRCLARRAQSAPQRQMGKAERRLNVKNQFSVRNAANVRGKALLLVDDVVTTGHTASECARVLKEAGARSVAVLALARGL